jgi:hypothetical protein
MKLTKRQRADAKRALRYAQRGIPIKDAFETGNDEEELFIVLLRIVLSKE